MVKNVSGQNVGFQGTSASDGFTPITTGAPTIYVTQDGGTQATGSGTVTHAGNGQWIYTPTQAETDCEHMLITFILADAITQALNIYPSDVTASPVPSLVPTH